MRCIFFSSHALVSDESNKKRVRLISVARRTCTSGSGLKNIALMASIVVYAGILHESCHPHL